MSTNVKNYVAMTGMSLDSVWATDAEIMATASLIGCNILVHSNFGSSTQWLTYPASFSLNRLTDNAIHIENVSAHFNVVINVVADEQLK